MYLLAILVPPLAVLFCRKPFQALINFGLCFLIWIPAVIHAFAVVGEYKAQKRAKEQERMMQQMMTRR